MTPERKAEIERQQAAYDLHVHATQQALRANLALSHALGKPCGDKGNALAIRSAKHYNEGVRLYQAIQKHFAPHVKS